MTSPEYTRAIFLREPKHRFLSAFLDKALSNSGSFVIKKCCPKTKDCLENAQTLSGFLDLVKRCHNPHWAPQSQRMEPKYWRYIDFVGHVESIEEDSKRLLQKVRAWEDYGKSNSVFERKAAASQNHATNSEGKVSLYFSPSH